MTQHPGKISFNGIDPLTGLPARPPSGSRWLASQIRRMERDVDAERKLRGAYDDRERDPNRRTAEGVDPLDLASCGWGVIFPEDPQLRESLKEALGPLLERRKEQAARWKEEYYRELLYHEGEIKDSFYKKYTIERGPAHPDNLPYYLLIVGEPEIIPHRFQYLLDMQHGVGRIAFDDLDGYARYAQSVIDAEEGRFHVRPEMTFFAVTNEGDKATERSDRGMVRPLLQALEKDREEWAVHRADWAGKNTLEALLGGASTPAFLFTAAHGLVYRHGHPLQARNQGAILCQDWKGSGPVGEDQFFAAADVGDNARLHGLIAFLFGCYSAGTPRNDNFPPPPMRKRRSVAPRSFLSPLARRLLSHPGGGALAVMGHVDRAWTRTFGTGRGKGCRHVESLVKYLLDGYPVGAAMDWMNERFAELSTELTDVLDREKEPLRAGSPDVRNHRWLSGLWRANNDARNFVVIGDPAVRLTTGPRRAILGRAAASSESRPTKAVPLRTALGGLRGSEHRYLQIAPSQFLHERRGTLP